MRVIYGLGALVAATAVLTGLVRLLEPRFAFFPTSGETTTPAHFGVPYQSADVETRDGERLRVWTLGPAMGRARIVYFHGNGGNLSVWAPILSAIASRGYSVLAFDYRGYGASTGRPSERGLYRDVDAIVEYAARQGGSSAAPVVFWGRSLGTTMAAYAATVRQPDGLILEAGFPDARSLVKSAPPLALLSMFSSYRFPTADLLRTVQAPALVIHGDADSVVPFELGRSLFDRIAGPKQFVTIRGGDHNDAAPADPQTYWTAVDGFVARLRTA